MNPRTIRITEPCEFGDPGDRLRPEPYDVAALLVEIRGVAVYEDAPDEAGATAPRPFVKPASPGRKNAGRRAPAGP